MERMERNSVKWIYITINSDILLGRYEAYL